MTFTVPLDTAPFVKLSILVVGAFVCGLLLPLILVRNIGAARHIYRNAINGYSINIFAMFGMILTIGIIVDDAIVVVENVERLMEGKNVSTGYQL